MRIPALTGTGAPVASPTRPASAQPMAVPDSKPGGMTESFFSALNSSVARVLFHSTESPAPV